jgi:predicted Zn-dependent peptidase
VIQQETYQQEQIAVGTPLVARDDPRYYAGALLSSILGDDTGSRLFWALNQTGLAETATAETMSYEDNGMMLTHIVTEPGLAQRALDAAEGEIRRVQEFDVGPEELDRAKAKLVSSVIIGGESTNERVMELINSWLTFGRLETLEEIRQKIDAVTLEDLRSLVAELPLWPQQTITAVGPVSESELRRPA